MTSRVALVTGGTGGIGTAIVRRLAASGHRVASNYRDEAKARDWQARLRSEGIEALLVPGDVCDSDSCVAMVRAIEKALGPIGILVNNAGITRDSTFHRMTYQQWNDVIHTNLNACFNVTRPVIEGMRERKWGRIVQISSINGQKGQYGQANYAAAKAGLIGMTKALAQEVASRGITVNAVAPGFIATPMTDKLSEAQKTRISGAIPLGRLGLPADVAAAVVYLASDEAAWVTGATIHVNGGMAMP